MADCPFCNAEVTEELLRFGGSCPHCFNVIPGEEAPTDPGTGEQRLLEETDRRVVGQDGGNKLLWAALALFGLGIAGGGLWWSQRSVMLPETPGDGEISDVFQVELEELVQTSTMAIVGAETEDAAQESSDKPEVVATMPQTFSTGSSGSSVSTEVEDDVDPSPLGGPRVVVRRRSMERAPLSDEGQIESEVQGTLRATNARMQHCYNQRIKEASALHGSWMVQFTVETDGTTSQVMARPQTMADAEFQLCLERQIGELRFPRITRPMPFAKRYTFGS